MRGVNSAVTERHSSCASVGVFTAGVNQHDMVIGMRLLLKITIALFRTSFPGCECTGDDRDFLAFA